ncbi:MAG: hypothetical protein HN931_00285 [Desulfobacterales bacterium]|nr:hypothetical protein [Desulfobacteraceae bacterium]MBT7084598.1 hypothetical protein [Desulfobacterales bacterium]
MVYILFTKIFSPEKEKNKGKPPALLIASIFMMHPLQTETVNNIVNSSGMLMTFFYILSLLYFAKYKLISNKSYNHDIKIKFRFNSFFILSLFFGILSQFCKESAITLIFSLWGLNYILEKKVHRSTLSFFSIQHIRSLYPFFITLVIVPSMLKILPYKHQGIGFSVIDPWLHFVTQWEILAMYLLKFFVPIGQNFDYDIPLAKSTFEFLPIAGLSLLLFITIFAWMQRKRIPWLPAGWFFFLAAISPNISVPNIDFAAERYVYLPLIGFSTATVATLYHYMPRKYIYLIVCFFIYLTIFTGFRNQVWSNDMILYVDTIIKSPTNMRPVVGYAESLFYNGKFKEMLSIYENVIKKIPIKPRGYFYVKVLNEVAISYMLQNDYEKALLVLEDSIRSSNGNTKTIFLLKGIALLGLGEQEEAMALLKNRFNIDPGQPGIFFLLASHEKNNNNIGKALNYLDIACESYFPPACKEYEKLKNGE